MKSRLKRKKRKARKARQRLARWVEVGREHRMEWWTLWGQQL